MRRVRCAIYTRKSSEDGLEQEFNSLDAQREACEAYIASQKHEGWELLLDRYDDGGISGGHLERPALQRLMQAVDEKRVDQIVVYKIDRLTRSLADFAKLVDRLDQVEASFVSVTQSFNTATSMGRLTLNVLLSFAQFEREVTAERIRDKIAASKRKGLWMGGYGANTAYSQSKLAQMMFAYELQDRLAAAGRNDVEVYVCHPGSSATSRITTSGSRTMRFIWWLMTKTPMVQTAEQGSYPEVLCATEEALTEQRALYGPTGRMEAVGPVGKGTLNAHAHDKAVMSRLWEVSEIAVGLKWKL